MDNGDHDHREQLELHVGGTQIINILTAGSLTSRLQTKGERSRFNHAGLERLCRLWNA